MNQGKNAKPFGAGVGGKGHAGLNLPKRDVVVVNDDLVDQKGAEKLAANEDEGSSSPLPERVNFHLHCAWIYAVFLSKGVTKYNSMIFIFRYRLETLPCIS